ncbi:MAG: glycosyltransferase family 1 protein [Candidatus Falkowbacteria bacterium]
MIIGIDASRANRKNKTGTEWYSFYLIKSLAKIDFNNKYILYLDKLPSPELIKVIKNNQNFSYKILNWPITSFWTLGRLSLEMLVKAPDVLFVPAHGIPLIHPKRTINTIHDVAFMSERNVYRLEAPKAKTKLRRQILKAIIRLVTFGRYEGNSLDYLYWSTLFALRHASNIITVSNFTKEEILRYYPKVKSDKITVIHNGFPTEIFNEIIDKPKILETLNKYNLTSPYYLYVGRLERKKNTSYLIEALSILRSDHQEIKEKLVLIGNASYGYDEVKYAIEEFDLSHEVLMPGWVEENDLPNIFKGASAFIFPTRHEGFGIPVLQALACGVPTAVSDLPVLHEVAEDSVLYFDQNNKQAIAQAMAKIVSDKDLRHKLITAGREQVKKFSWLNCAKETLAVMEKRF